jgi:hypothetical protein
MALGVLLAVWLAIPDPPDWETPFWEEEEKIPPGWPGWRLALVGAVCALVVLTHYLLVAVALAVGVYLVFSQPRRGRALAWFLAGFLLLLLPWMIRSFCLVGSPFFSLFWYEMLANTVTYPGESLWRTATLPPSPVFFLFQHPLEVARKVLTGLNQFWEATPGVVNPVIGFLFLASLFHGTNRFPVSGLRGLVAGSLILGVVGSCLLRPEPALLLAWSPLFAIFGAGYLSEQIALRFSSGVWDSDDEDFSAEDTPSGRPPANRWSTIAGLAALGLVAFPFFFFMVMSRPGPEPRVGPPVGTLQTLLPPATTVMTDQPAAVAWYADRRAVWLCQRLEDWAGLESLPRPVDAVYVTPALDRMAEDERGAWWFWLRSPQGAFRDFVPANSGAAPGVLRVRTPPETPAEPGGNR